MLPLLDIKNLSVCFNTESGSTYALKNVSLQAQRAEVIALVGESGSGKSVLSLSILQLLAMPPAKIESGQILFSETGVNSFDLLTANKKQLQQIRGQKIAMIFQEPMTSLNPSLTCGRQVAEVMQAHKKYTAKKAKLETIKWFEKVKLPSPEKTFKKYPHQLSGGQKQRVMIAMAMCCNPSLLICDEPTTALDVTVQKVVLDLIKELQQENGLTVIFITHDLGVVADIAHKTIVLYKGEVMEANSVRNIFLHPQHPYTKALLACRPIHCKHGQRLPVIKDFLEPDSNKFVNNPTFINTIDEASQLSEKNVLLSVKNLSVQFPFVKNFWGNPIKFINAVDDVSFDVYKNETLGLAGESGCGKTTLGRAILQLIKPTAGHVIYNDIDLTIASNSLRQLRKEMQIVFQDPYSSLNPRLSIGHAIAEPMKIHSILNSAAARKERVIELLKKVGLDATHFNRFPHEFSGGQRQRIVIARALALNPSFILCDESVSALDVSVQAQVLNLLNDLKTDLGFTIVFISHDLSVLKYFCNRMLVMKQGKIVESGPADDVYNHPQTAYTKQLIAAIPKENFTVVH